MKIGEILVQKGYVTQQQIDGVLAVKGDDAQVGQVLIQWGLLTQEQLMEALDIQAPPPPPPCTYEDYLEGDALKMRLGLKTCPNLPILPISLSLLVLINKFG